VRGQRRVFTDVILYLRGFSGRFQLPWTEPEKLLGGCLIHRIGKVEE
jgi:hypothetical protein